MNQHPRNDLMKQLLEQKIEMIDAFTVHLDAIKQSISHNQLDQLQSLIENTPTFYSDLDRNQMKLSIALTESGYSGDQALSQYLDQQSSQFESWKTLYDALKVKTDSLKKALMINDLLIKKNQHRIRQSIRILSGHGSDSGPATYNQSGTTYDANGSHSLAHA